MRRWRGLVGVGNQTITRPRERKKVSATALGGLPPICRPAIRKTRRARGKKRAIREGKKRKNPAVMETETINGGVGRESRATLKRVKEPLKGRNEENQLTVLGKTRMIALST